LICVAFQADNFALPQMKLARMLMVCKDSRHTAIDMLGHEQEGLDALIGLNCVFDSLSYVQATISCFQKNSIKWASYWKGAKKPLQIIAIHDLKHPIQRPLVNSVLGSQTGCLDCPCNQRTLELALSAIALSLDLYARN